VPPHLRKSLLHLYDLEAAEAAHAAGGGVYFGQHAQMTPVPAAVVHVFRPEDRGIRGEVWGILSQCLPGSASALAVEATLREVHGRP